MDCFKEPLYGWYDRVSYSKDKTGVYRYYHLEHQIVGIKKLKDQWDMEKEAELKKMRKR